MEETKEKNQVSPEETVRSAANKETAQRSLKSEIADSAKEQLGELADQAKEHLNEFADGVKETVTETSRNALVWLFGTFYGWMVVLSVVAILVIGFVWSFLWGFILVALAWSYALYRKIKNLWF